MAGITPDPLLSCLGRRHCTRPARDRAPAACLPPVTSRKLTEKDVVQRLCSWTLAAAQVYAACEIVFVHLHLFPRALSATLALYLGVGVAAMAFQWALQVHLHASAARSFARQRCIMSVASGGHALMQKWCDAALRAGTRAASDGRRHGHRGDRRDIAGGYSGMSSHIVQPQREPASGESTV